jgi:hypothetical protein
MPPFRLPAAVLRAAILGGVVVGIADGIRAAVQARAPFVPFLTCVLLTLGFDLLVAAAGGGLAALLLWLAAWGRAGKHGGIAASVGWLLAGGAPAGAALAAVVGTATRNNRFLAGGVVALVSLAAAVAAAALGPALGRLVGLLPGLGARADARRRHSPMTAAGVLVLAPLVVLILEAVVLLLVWRTRAPLPKRVLAERATWAACTVGLLPFLLAWTSRQAPRLRWWIAAGLSFLLFAGPAAVLLKARWVQDFQFMAWNQILVAVGLLLTTAGLTSLLLGRTLPRPWDRFVTLGLPGLALVAVFAASEHEPARKAAGARAALTGELVASSAAAIATTAIPSAIRARATGPTTASIRIATARTRPPRPCARRPSNPCPRRCPPRSRYCS